MNTCEENSSERLTLEAVLNQYRDYLLRERLVLEETAKVRCKQAKRFLGHIFKGRSFHIETLSFEDVIDFFDNGINGPKKKTGQSVPTTMKVFLRFLFLKGITEKNLADIVPKIRQRLHSTHEKSLDIEKAEKLLSVIPRTGELGTRNYAMVALMLYAGLRSREVVDLKTTDIDFQTARINFIGKGKKESMMPLFENVAEAIIEYLKEKKFPNTEYLFVIITDHKSPIKNTRVIRNVTKKAYDLSGIIPPNDCKGTHALRHSFARHLTSQNLPLKAIAELMRHESLDTTLLYARSDIASLRTIAPEWPTLW